ncbi:hypothetical protein IE53DRAFT_390358 [Violaceomyces palustris]|uniref:Uncharacterized protein n=1 Tax=Violaceomyces palustris TaxID=1673888 RepID=A0ACD0NNV5_9BASI|nr:hypothetical protein IE53DRAFT_390358 [Violaceomyces palustris]
MTSDQPSSDRTQPAEQAQNAAVPTLETDQEMTSTEQSSIPIHPNAHPDQPMVEQDDGQEQSQQGEEQQDEALDPSSDATLLVDGQQQSSNNLGGSKAAAATYSNSSRTGHPFPTGAGNHHSNSDDSGFGLTGFERRGEDRVGSTWPFASPSHPSFFRPLHPPRLLSTCAISLHRDS